MLVKILERDSSVIGLQESVYPPFYSWGAPRRHHAVVYFHIPVAKSSSELDREMVLQQEEVDASAWLSVRHAKIVVHGIQGGPKGFYTGN